MTLPHTHETGECLACDLETVGELVPWQGMRRGKAGAALARISTALATQQSALGGAESQAEADMELIEQTKRECREALATSQARVAELTERHAHQCRLNVTLVEQNAKLIQRNTELERARKAKG